MARWACVRQHDQRDCGAAALATVVKQHGLDIGIGRVRELAGTDRVGTSLLGLVEASERLGLRAKAVRGPLEALPGIPVPAIAHVVTAQGLSHFVVLHRVRKKDVLVADPGRGIVTLSLAEFAKIWKGYLLLLVPTPALRSVPGRTGLWARFLPLLRPTLPLTLEAFFCTLLYTVLGLGSSFYIQFLVDHVFVHREPHLLNLATAGLLLLVLLRLLFGTLRQYFLLHVGQNVDLTLISAYYRHILTLPMRFFDTRKTGEVLSRVNDAVKVRQALSGVTLSAVVDAIMIVVSVAVMYAVHPGLATVCVLLVPLFGLVFYLQAAPLAARQRRIMENAAELQSCLVEDVEGVATLKVFGAERRRQALTEASLVRVVKSVFSLGAISLTSQNLVALLSGAGTVGVLWYGAHLALEGVLTPGQVLFFHSLLAAMLGPIERMSGLQATFQDAGIAMERLGDILDLETEKNWDEGAKAEWPGLSKGIVFQGVSFAYGSRGKVLDRIDLEIPAGRTVALVGESGSGKTTCCGLLARYHDPTEGRVLVDDFDLRDLRLAALRSQVGIVAQDPYLFNGTIRDNIALGKPNATLEEVIAAARGAHIHDFISKLPGRYETMVGERGVNLSGGQRQRIAIARALLQDPALLIFDEATSHLDSESERAIHRSLRDVLRNRTAVIVAHRLSTIRNADRIVVFHEGRIVEQGSHDELLARGGAYHRLWTTQMAPDAGLEAPAAG